MPDSLTRGTLLQIGDGNIDPGPEGFLTVGRLFNVGEVKGTRSVEDVTAHDSPGRADEFLGDALNFGTTPIEYRFRAPEPGQDALKAAFEDGELHNFRIVYPNTAGKRWAGAAIVIEHSVSEAPVKGVLNGRVLLQWSGKPVLENVV